MQKNSAGLLFCLNLWVLDIFFLATLLWLPVIWIGAPLQLHIGATGVTLAWHIGWLAAPVLVLVSRYAVAGWAARRPVPCQGLWERFWFRRLSFSLLLTFLFFDAVEVILAHIGFEAKFPPVVFEGKNVQGQLQIAYVDPDPQLLWKYRPGSQFNGRQINRLGFREREVEPEKQPGTVRVICMGDSVTAQGRPCYSEYLHRSLSGNPPTSNRWEAFNMAVYGYSSRQGLRLFQLTKDRLRPDIVTLYFGWNDHWLNHATDREEMALEMRPLAGRIVEALHNKRFFQLIVWLLNPVTHMARVDQNSGFHFVHRNIPPSAAASAQWTLRVPPEDFRVVLTAFIREIRAGNAIPLLITAPRRHLTKMLEERRHAFSMAEAEQLHDQYVAITREVARDCHAELLDLAKLMAGPECDAFFQPDGIHFDYSELEGQLQKASDQQPGLLHIAEELDQAIRHIVTTEAWRVKQAHDR